MAQIVLKELTKHFDQVKAVESLNLEIKDREFVVLLGASGSGKSTTLNLIAGIEEPTSGDVFEDGQRITDNPPNERDMAMVFQSYALYPQMTVFENIVFSLKLKKTPMGQRRERARRIAEMLGISELMDRKPSQLSGGQQQRVALGRAIIRNPKVFLLDEPLSNLDAKLRLKMRSELRSLHLELGVTTIYVTHDQVEAMTMADKIALLKDGELVAYDTPRNLYNHPPNMYTADFLGSPPINLLSGLLEERNGRMIFSFEGFSFHLAPELESRLSQGGFSAPGRAVVGIRPENIILRRADEGRQEIVADIFLTELVGADSFMHIKLSPEFKIICRVDADAEWRIGDRVAIVFQQEKISLFDEATGRRIN
jgi:multiple sugar transport system ATP-binding protein